MAAHGSNWPVERLRRYHRVTFWLVATVFFGTFIALLMLTSAADKAVENRKDELNRVVQLVNEIDVLKKQRGPFADFDAHEAMLAVLDLTGLQDNLVSRRRTEVGGDDAVQVMLEELTLSEIVALLRVLKEQASLQAHSFTISRNFFDPRLADIHMVLGR